MKDSKGMLHSTEHVFYSLLAHMAAIKNEGRRISGGVRRQLARDVRQYERWAQSCEANFQAKALALRGELLSTEGDGHEALAWFARSAADAARFGQPHVAGLACRLAAEACRKMGRKDDAHKRLAEAREHYTRWGATGYANWLNDTGAMNDELS
jgi:hypothetical protein